MKSQRFDVLPVFGSSCRTYFSTATWGDYSNIAEKIIKHSDVVPYNTSLRETIKRLAIESRNFFFLEEDGEIVGLISIANLNCRQVTLFILGLMVELEVRMSEAFARNSDEQVEKILAQSCSDKRLQDITSRSQEDQRKGLDIPLIEYVYLSDLMRMAVTSELFEQLGYSKQKFESVAGSLIDLRNSAAHPTRSLIRPNHSVQKLWERIDKAEELLFSIKSNFTQ